MCLVGCFRLEDPHLPHKERTVYYMMLMCSVCLSALLYISKTEDGILLT